LLIAKISDVNKDWTCKDNGQGPSLQGPGQGLDLQGLDKDKT